MKKKPHRTLPVIAVTAVKVHIVTGHSHPRDLFSQFVVLQGEISLQKPFEGSINDVCKQQARIALFSS